MSVDETQTEAPPKGIHLGGGIVLYENAFDLDWDWMREFCQNTLREERETSYTPGIDPITGQEGYINRSKFFFEKDTLDEMPWRGSLVHQNPDPKVIETLDYIESRRDLCLLDYLNQFPMAGKTIWWKIRGHIVAYPKVAFLGTHSDVSTDYEYGKPHPRDQLATRSSVSVVAYINDWVETEDELDGTNFTGGEHSFAYYDISIKPKRGNMIFFPANYLAAHEVKPVTGGWRYSYLGWYCQGSPNGQYLEAVADPVTEPETAKIASNVYMTEGYSILPPIGFN